MFPDDLQGIMFPDDLQGIMFPDDLDLFPGVWSVLIFI